MGYFKALEFCRITDLISYNSTIATDTAGIIIKNEVRLLELLNCLNATHTVDQL